MSSVDYIPASDADFLLWVQAFSSGISADAAAFMMTPAQAAALVEADKQQRVKKAAEAVQAALAEHRCDLIAVPHSTKIKAIWLASTREKSIKA